MGRKDVVSRQYLSSDEVFADVVNLALYEGERIVQASDLVELDSTEEIAVTLEESLKVHIWCGHGVVKICIIYGEVSTVCR